MVLDLTTREFDPTLHADKSLKIEAKLGDRQNWASSQSYIFFIKDWPQGFSGDDISYGAYFSTVLVRLK